jgi:hypothetical protein
MLAQTVVTVWLADGIPARLVADGVRWRVVDTPTRLSAEDLMAVTWHPAMTHPLKVWEGWRFSARNESGDSMVFDVRRGEDEPEWRVVRTYE